MGPNTYHLPFVLVDAFVIIINNIHGIVTIDKRYGNGDRNITGYGNEDKFCKQIRRHVLKPDVCCFPIKLILQPFTKLINPKLFQINLHIS